MIIDASRGEIQLDDLFNAIEHDKDQVAQALDLYGEYLKVKNENTIDGGKKVELLERILKLECIEKTVVNHNHENERSRINLKWTVLTECGIWYRKLGSYEKAIRCFDNANAINNRVSTIYYEMGMCYLELSDIYQVKICLEKTIEISHEHIHWKCLEQIIYFYYILGNFSKCLEYIRIGYDRVATSQSIYDLGQLCLVLLERKQPSMKILVEKMFKNEIEYIVHDDDLLKRIQELEANIAKFKEKLFNRSNRIVDRKSIDERASIENFQELGQYLTKKIRESSNDDMKLCKLIDINNFLPEKPVVVEAPQPEPMEQETVISEEQPPPPAPTQRKKRSQLPLNLDDYEKRRSARSVTRMISDENNVSTVDKLKRLLANKDDSSDEEADETLISPDNLDEESTLALPSDVPKETFPSLTIEYKSFIQLIDDTIKTGHQFHCLDFICEYVNELTKHSSTLWSAEMRMIFTKLFDCLVDHVQYPTTEIEPNHLRACVCYVENALGSAKSDLSEDSIERFSCFARLKVKYKFLGYCFARLQFFLYLFKNSPIQQTEFEIDELFYRILWISSLYYFLSDVQDDALACVYQLQRVLPEGLTIVLPNLFNHATISKSTIEALCLRLKNSSSTSSNSSSSQELTYILSRIAVADEKDELVSLIKKLEKKIKLFYANLSTQLQLQQKSLIKCYETLISVLNENQHLNDKDNRNVRKIFDQILIQVIDMMIKILNEDSPWRDVSLKTVEKLTLNLIDSIMKRDCSGEDVWPFKSTNPWILLYRATMKRDSKKNEQFIISFVRTIHELFGKHELCLIENGILLEYFLLELIQIEHPDIRKILFSKQNIDSKSLEEGDEQKNKFSKVMDEIEQCIYCLYGLVVRKSKMKYLDDHNCRSLELTLEKASIVFYALRPRQLPGYEGRTCTVTNETESLFQRFESMIEWDDEREHRRKLLISYVSDATSINSQGKQSEELLHLSDKPFTANNALFEKDLYYLFADYHLKMGSKDAVSNESSNKKAQEYYIKDLCMNTKRFDSWAGLTVIEFAKIEELITADDFDARIFNVHMSASCYFRQAVSVDSNNHTLWMEYAEITYVLQSYCSKYREKAAEYVPERSFLLNICKEAYEKANLCTDNDDNKEDWTHLYMMAKIEEKLHRSKLLDSLKKYASALDLLHENKAVYPRKLGHHTSTSNSKGTLLGCHAVEMFYRIHASTLKYLNRHNKETVDFTIEKLNELHEFLVEMQTKAFATSYYEKSTIPSDAHSNQLISAQYFPAQQDQTTDPWLTLYHKCIWLCIEGLYICIARYNRHYRALYRLAHFFHTNEYYRNDRLSLEFFLGGSVLELKNYPRVIGLYQERSKHNLFNGIWRIQPLDADRTGSFNASMYKSTRLFVDLLLRFEENFVILLEVLRQLLAKPDPDKKYVREVERKMLCQHTIRNFVRTVKKKVTSKTRDDIEREGLKILASMDESDPNSVSIPILFETSIHLYNLIRNYPEFYHNSRLDELVESTFLRYRSILKFSSHLPENPKAENLTLIYTPKKQKSKKRPATIVEQPSASKRVDFERSPISSVVTTDQSAADKRLAPEPAPLSSTRTTEQSVTNNGESSETSLASSSTIAKQSSANEPLLVVSTIEKSDVNKRSGEGKSAVKSSASFEEPTVSDYTCLPKSPLPSTVIAEQSIRKKHPPLIPTSGLTTTTAEQSDVKKHSSPEPSTASIGQPSSNKRPREESLPTSSTTSTEQPTSRKRLHTEPLPASTIISPELSLISGHSCAKPLSISSAVPTEQETLKERSYHPTSSATHIEQPLAAKHQSPRLSLVPSTIATEQQTVKKHLGPESLLIEPTATVESPVLNKQPRPETSVIPVVITKEQSMATKREFSGLLPASSTATTAQQTLKKHLDPESTSVLSATVKEPELMHKRLAAEPLPIPPMIIREQPGTVKQQFPALSAVSSIHTTEPEIIEKYPTPELLSVPLATTMGQQNMTKHPPPQPSSIPSITISEHPVINRSSHSQPVSLSSGITVEQPIVNRRSYIEFLLDPPTDIIEQRVVHKLLSPDPPVIPSVVTSEQPMATNRQFPMLPPVLSASTTTQQVVSQRLSPEPASIITNQESMIHRRISPQPRPLPRIISTEEAVVKKRSTPEQLPFRSTITVEQPVVRKCSFAEPPSIPSTTATEQPVVDRRPFVEPLITANNQAIVNKRRSPDPASVLPSSTTDEPIVNTNPAREPPPLSPSSSSSSSPTTTADNFLGLASFLHYDSI
ncbi:unnamed protein product [Adineta ricciae]|uniref:Uncharacterized protein n=1 Tax=Adineta ricciae TaxID=249248 RepID=A0A813TBX7_ADIRI|nr:unnamed protein product [Adineta ricciae]